MNHKAKTLCAVFLTAAMTAGCGTSPPVKQHMASAAPHPVTYFKFTLMNQTLDLVIKNSIVNPTPEALAKAVIDGVRQDVDSLGGTYADFDDAQVKAAIDDPNNPQRDIIFEVGIKAAMESLSPHDSYMSHERVKDYVLGLSRVRGIGTQFIGDPDTGGLMVEEVAEIGPAARADIKPGDIVLAVDGHPINGDMVRGVDMIRGENGSSVSLTVLRAGQRKPVTIVAQRGEFFFRPVLYKMIDDVAYIRLRDFRSRKAGEMISEAIKDMQTQQGARPIKGYILDLRGNPGGNVVEAGEIADNFIDVENGISFHVEGKVVSYDEKLTPGDILKGVPMAMIINDESMSAAELLAGAFQDHKRAVIIGTQSFGKGSVQTTEFLSGIEKSRYDGIRVTNGLYFLPSGVSIQKLGVMPDILVEGVADIRSEHERDLKNAIPNPTESAARARQPRSTCAIDPDLRGADLSVLLRDFRGMPDKALICAYEHLRQTDEYSRSRPLATSAMALRP